MALLLLASLLTDSSLFAGGNEISPREVYCNIHENHTLCIHQVSEMSVYGLQNSHNLELFSESYG